MSDLQSLLAKVEAGDLRDHGLMYRAIGDDLSLCYEAYRGSLDAAKNLHEAVLPGWWWVKPDRVESGTIHVVGPDNGDYYPSAVGKHPDPARAWLIAILKALIAQEP